MKIVEYSWDIYMSFLNPAQGAIQDLAQSWIDSAESEPAYFLVTASCGSP